MPRLTGKGQDRYCGQRAQRARRGERGECECGAAGCGMQVLAHKHRATCQRLQGGGCRAAVQAEAQAQPPPRVISLAVYKGARASLTSARCTRRPSTSHRFWPVLHRSRPIDSKPPRPVRSEAQEPGRAQQGPASTCGRAGRELGWRGGAPG